MKSKSRMSVYGKFILKAILVASLIMFGCMALGEIFYDRNLFSGFLGKPLLWAGVFLETSVATILLAAVGALILYRFRFLSQKLFAGVSLAVWCLLDLILIVLYGHFYWEREWHITAMTPGLIFGWILPGLLTLVCFVALSFDLRQISRD